MAKKKQKKKPRLSERDILNPNVEVEDLPVLPPSPDMRHQSQKHSYNTKLNGKNATGAPTKYDPKYCQEIVEFFDVEPYEDIEIKHYYEKGSIKWIDYKRQTNKLPTLVGFARKIGVSVQTVFNWIKDGHASFQQEFFDAVTCVAKPLQKDHLIQNGLQGLYNPQAFKFVAVNCTDMEDKKGIEHSGELTITDIAAQMGAEDGK